MCSVLSHLFSCNHPNLEVNGWVIIPILPMKVGSKMKSNVPQVVVEPGIKHGSWGEAWVAQLAKYQTSAQVMASQFMSSSPVLGSVLTAQRQKPAFEFCVSLSLSALPHFLSLSLSLSQK